MHEKGGSCIVPPPIGATYKGASERWERDKCLATINGFGGGEEGRKLWKIYAQYHLRSLVETAMFRLKRMFGDGLKSRSIGAQKIEIICKSLVINKMNKLGTPKGKRVIKAA